MRSDMHKVIVERPRELRSNWKNLKTAQRLGLDQRMQAQNEPDDYDSGPSRAPVARHSKWLNENLAPLRRYLFKQVGRPWNKVYSEICQSIDTRSAIGLHVLQHIEDFVKRDVFFENGVPYTRVYKYIHPVEGMYVHPVTGLIRIAKVREAPVEPKPFEVVRLSRTSEFRKIDGLWFRVEFRLVGPDEFIELEDGRKVRASGAGIQRLMIDKRQCDGKTIRKIEAGGFVSIPARCGDR